MIIEELPIPSWAECDRCIFAKDFGELLKCHRTAVQRPVKYYDDFCKHWENEK